MTIVLEETPSIGKRLLAIFVFFAILTSFWSLGLFVQAKINKKIRVDSVASSAIIQGNSFLAVSNYKNPIKIKKAKMIITAYSSDPQETDDTPFITASGERVKDGIIANNLLPFGTKVKIPKLYGDKVFVVKDRMNPRKSRYQMDIWFKDKQQAKDFGVIKTDIEILEN